MREVDRVLDASTVEIDSLELSVEEAAGAEAAPRKRLRPRPSQSSRLKVCRQRLATVRESLRRLRELTPPDRCEEVKSWERATAEMLRRHPNGGEALAVLARQQ
jgi:hypothetical protein